jgi:hypothetical protein
MGGLGFLGGAFGFADRADFSAGARADSFRHDATASSNSSHPQRLMKGP